MIWTRSPDRRWPFAVQTEWHFLTVNCLAPFSSWIWTSDSEVKDFDSKFDQSANASRKTRRFNWRVLFKQNPLNKLCIFNFAAQTLYQLTWSARFRRASLEERLLPALPNLYGTVHVNGKFLERRKMQRTCFSKSTAFCSFFFEKFVGKKCGF